MVSGVVTDIRVGLIPHLMRRLVTLLCPLNTSSPPVTLTPEPCPQILHMLPEGRGGKRENRGEKVALPIGVHRLGAASYFTLDSGLSFQTFCKEKVGP